MDEFLKSPYSTAIPEFSSVENWKIDNYVSWFPDNDVAVVDSEFWLILSFAMVINIPFPNVPGKNAPPLLYWDIIRFSMSLVSSSELLHERDIPAQKYSQLTSVFKRLELYNLTATYNGNGGWVFLLCRLYKDLPLFFILYWSCK